MTRLHSFITLICLVIHALGMPLDDDASDGCWELVDQPLGGTSNHHNLEDGPSVSVLAPFEQAPVPQPSQSQSPHATLPVTHHDQTPAILGSTFGILAALIALYVAARYVSRRQGLCADPLKDPSRVRFTAFRFRPRSNTSRKRLSDESWVSPVLPDLGSPGSPLSHDHELSRYAFPRRKPAPVATPTSSPTETEFGSRTEFVNGDSIYGVSSVVPVPAVRVPSPVYIPPFSPSPSLTSSSSSISPTPSVEPLPSPTSNQARLSNLLSSRFRSQRLVESPARPTTAHIIQTARAYAHAYRPSSATSASLYTQPTLSTRLSGTSFFRGSTVRDTLSTVTTSDTESGIPHLLRAVSEDPPAVSPFADPDAGTRRPVGTSLGMKLRLSDASEHARYRLRERERQRERQRVRQRLSGASTAASVETEGGRKEFRLRDSESVLREIGW